MCTVGDEWVLLSMLVLQCVAGLPVMALMKLCGISYAVLYSFGVLASLSLTFAPRLRTRCCAKFVHLVNEHGLWIFLLTHMALLSLASYTLYEFLLPFIHSDSNFRAFCVSHKLYDNLTHTSCDRLQPLYALSLVALTVASLASAYLLLLGARITRLNWQQLAANDGDDVHLLKTASSSRHSSSSSHSNTRRGSSSPRA